MRETGDRGGLVLAVYSSPSHSFTKSQQPDITLLEGLGVEGDAHCGVTVKHRHDAKKDPMRPNFRQVHLLQAELLDEVKRKGFDVGLGELGENIATRGIDLLALPTGAILHIGGEAVASDDAETATFYTLNEMTALPLAGSVFAVAEDLLDPGGDAGPLEL